MDNRAKIIKAAMRLFSEGGYAGTSLRSIAKEAGVSLALITQFFKTKDNLHRAVDAHVLAEMDAAMGALEEVDSDNYFESVLAINVDFTLTHEAEYRYIRRALIDESPGSNGFFKYYYKKHKEGLVKGRDIGAIDLEEKYDDWYVFTSIFLMLGPLFCMPYIADITGEGVFESGVLKKRNAFYAKMMSRAFGKVNDAL